MAVAPYDQLLSNQNPVLSELTKTTDYFHKRITQVEESLERIDKVCKCILDILYMPWKNDMPPEFSYKEREFFEEHFKLCDAIGRGFKLILDIDRERRMLEKGITPRQTQPSEETAKTSPPIVINQASPQNPVKTGFWGPYYFYKARKAELEFQREQLERIRTTPVVSEKPVLDITEYGRQLLAARHRLREWMRKAKKRATLYGINKKAFEHYHDRLVSYIQRVMDTARTFSTTQVEYKTDNLEQHLSNAMRAYSSVMQASLMMPTMIGQLSRGPIAPGPSFYSTSSPPSRYEG